MYGYSPPLQKATDGRLTFMHHEIGESAVCMVRSCDVM